MLKKTRQYKPKSKWKQFLNSEWYLAFGSMLSTLFGLLIIILIISLFR